MKYTTEILINVPRPNFIEKMDSSENMKHWHEGLVDYKLLYGDPGKEGSKMEMHYKMGKRDTILIETIIKTNFPHEFHATYDTKGVHNIQKNYFKDVGGHSTLWLSESEFRFPGFMMKVIAFVMPAAFKKQSKKFMENFKAFAESGISVANR